MTKTGQQPTPYNKNLTQSTNPELKPSTKNLPYVPHGTVSKTIKIQSYIADLLMMPGRSIRLSLHLKVLGLVFLVIWSGTILIASWRFISFIQIRGLRLRTAKITMKRNSTPQPQRKCSKICPLIFLQTSTKIAPAKKSSHTTAW